MSGMGDWWGGFTAGKADEQGVIDISAADSAQRCGRANAGVD